MIKYKNISSYPLTFYGITFNPKEIKEVPGFINHIKMLRVNDNVKPEPKTQVIIEPVVELKSQVTEKPKRKYTKKDKTSNNTTGGVSDGKDNN